MTARHPWPVHDRQWTDSGPSFVKQKEKLEKESKEDRERKENFSLEVKDQNLKNLCSGINITGNHGEEYVLIGLYSNLECIVLLF